jgi:hypothetical protein
MMSTTRGSRSMRLFAGKSVMGGHALGPHPAREMLQGEARLDPKNPISEA